ncbi:MAG: tetratricopeptide (TPR) repeat protein, partial [Bacteroidia bacterium]
MKSVQNSSQLNIRLFSMKIACLLTGLLLSVSSFSQDAASLFKTAITKAQAGDMPGAIADFDKCIGLSPEYTDAYYWRGVAKAAIGEANGALADFERTTTLDPGHAQA